MFPAGPCACCLVPLRFLPCFIFIRLPFIIIIGPVFGALLLPLGEDGGEELLLLPLEPLLLDDFEDKEQAFDSLVFFPIFPFPLLPLEEEDDLDGEDLEEEDKDLVSLLFIPFIALHIPFPISLTIPFPIPLTIPLPIFLTIPLPIFLIIPLPIPLPVPPWDIATLVVLLSFGEEADAFKEDELDLASALTPTSGLYTARFHVQLGNGFACAICKSLCARKERLSVSTRRRVSSLSIVETGGRRSDARVQARNNERRRRTIVPLRKVGVFSPNL